jgi:hypothetical protein
MFEECAASNPPPPFGPRGGAHLQEQLIIAEEEFPHHKCSEAHGIFSMYSFISVHTIESDCAVRLQVHQHTD